MRTWKNLKKELSGLINELTGDEFAILGLNELINDEKEVNV